jgi:transposase-like protein
MRKISATRKMFPNDEAVIQILLHLRNFRNRWPRRPGWDVVLNQLAVMFGDRLKPEAGDALYL